MQEEHTTSDDDIYYDSLEHIAVESEEPQHSMESKVTSKGIAPGINLTIVVPAPVKLTVVPVDTTSATLSWEPPGGMDQTQLQYQVSYQCPGGEQHTTTTSSVSITLSDLRPASEYSISVCSLLDNEQKSLPVSQTFTTNIEPPRYITANTSTTTSILLSWGPPDGLEEPRFRVEWSSGGYSGHDTTNESSYNITNLMPGRQYDVKVATIRDDEQLSKFLTETQKTEPTSPVNLKVKEVKTTSVTLWWDSPINMAEGSYSFIVEYSSKGGQKKQQTTESNSAVLSNLDPGTSYTFSVATMLQNCSTSLRETVVQCTIVPAPLKLAIAPVDPTSATLSWEPPGGMDHTQLQYQVSYQYPGGEQHTTTTFSVSITLSDLRPALEYSVSVCSLLDNGQMSLPVSQTFTTRVPAPVDLTEKLHPTSVTLSWTMGQGMEQTPHHYLITYSSPGTQSQTIQTGDCCTTLTDLQPGTQYTVGVSTVLEDGGQSEPVSTTIITMCSLDSYLKTLGLEQFTEEKLTLNSTLAIKNQSAESQDISSLQSQWGVFLRELMKSNVSARDSLYIRSDEKDLVNPLDLITALLMCSDHFLQQEIILKMSMCQFAVPLLLPNCDTKQCTLMLWALRDIIKRYRTHSMGHNKFVENSIVLANLPMVSFVRLGYSSLSKSELLNEVLSKSQQTNRSFIYQNMMGGNIPRKISDGLVEMTWYLPNGNPNIDVFPEPVAVANLRGDIEDFPNQFKFLCKTSAAVFVFCDVLGSDGHLLKSQNLGDRQFIVSNTDAKGYDRAAFENVLQLKPSAHIKKDIRMNNVRLVQKLQSVVTDVLKTNPLKVTVEKMTEDAKKFEIQVDEDFKLCQDGKERACSITRQISDTAEFKKIHLPLHGETLAKCVKIEREESKLKELGNKNIETYKDELRKKKDDLRRKQVQEVNMDIMLIFIAALKESKVSRFFLKWMKGNLDIILRKCTSDLKEKYKSLCESSSGGDQTALSDLENKLTSNSLGTEHFLRELGQLYESAQSLPNKDPTRQQVEDLPRLCAQLMLDGFPLELIDGDASYIPMKWISQLLTELHQLTSSKSKVKVITVLGVQSSGKSTLLNTMFGVQFAVSGGRCTRGAFMQLIRVEEDLKKTLDCDFIMIIDTEGLKAPELAQLANSYEHDNELATLVVGLSDITIINNAMENAAEMKDTMQIVVHAFLRMKEVGKKHMCQFVHQNVPDCAAHAKNADDRKVLLQQLNEMTEVAAKMEKKEHNKKFTDIMEYDPEGDSWYLPGLWFGNPPMAPVNAGYSEAVNKLKKSIIQRLINMKTPAHSITDFSEWIENVWNAVKHENFIFSFRNSLEADAYSMLSVEFNRLDWSFRNEMQVWEREAEREISNCDTTGLNPLTSKLKNKSISKLQTELSKMQDRLEEYFKNAGKHAQFIEKHRQYFTNSAKAVQEEIERSVNHKLEMAATNKRSMAKIEEFQKTSTSILEDAVMKLLKECRSNEKEMTEEQLEAAFKITWTNTVQSLNISKLEKQDVDADILRELRKSMNNKNVTEIINKIVHLGNHPAIELEGPVSRVKAVAGKLKHFRVQNNSKEDRRQMASRIQQECERLIESTVYEGSDYQSIYAINVLERIDKILAKNNQIKFDTEFEAKLKIQICGYASRQYQKMHIAFLEANDPQRSLENLKPKYFDAFKDLFNDRDQCEKKAEEFTNLCLEPAVRKYINDCLGPDIVKTMMHRKIEGIEDIDFRTRTYFEFSILKQLLSRDDFEQFIIYTCNYYKFVRETILNTMAKLISQEKPSLSDLEKDNLNNIIDRIELVLKKLDSDTLTVGQPSSTTDACTFIDRICKDLKKDLCIPPDGLNSVLHLNKAKGTPFIKHLRDCVTKMQESLSKEFEQDTNVKDRIEKLSPKPQDELFDRMVGCGKTCPFCKAPCEAAGLGHKEHFTNVHRSTGTGRYQFILSKKLSTDICSSLVSGKQEFICSDTKNERHPFKDYRSIYPDWCIQPDSSIEASDYWKHVFAKYNQQFADAYRAEPADIPPGWHDITKEQAMESLEKVYRVKAQSS